MKKLIIVEDDEDLLNLLMALIQRLKAFEIVVAKNYQEGLSQLTNHTFDVLVSDIRLPDGDGFNLIKWGREHNRLPTTTVVFSGQNRYADTEFLNTGVARVFHKPQDLKTLIEYLKTLV